VSEAPTTADVVVAGAGHNGLVTAAYAARSGRSVVVLDARPIPGGGAASEELLLPGHLVDSCSIGHTLIRTNPLLVDDELGLLSRHGLHYLEPDPVAQVVFPDGEHLTMWLDVERTVTEIGRFSADDAATYRRFLDEWAEVGPVFGRHRNQPIGWGPDLDEALAEVPRGDVWRRRAALSAWDVVRREFTSRHVQAFVLWQAFQTFVSVDLPGTGTLPYSILAGRQRRSWCIPEGGSGRLTDALVADIEAHGGEIRCGREVTRLLLEEGRCAGVETATGERYLARDAVVSSIHVRHLVDMAPAESWDEGFVYGVETLDPGIPMFALHLVTDRPPRFPGAPEPGAAVSSGVVGWGEDLVAMVRDVRDRRAVTTFPWVLVATPTLADPSRVPAGRQTVKLLTPCSPTPPHGAPDWDVAREAHADRLLSHVRGFVDGLSDEAVLARLAQSPLDIERANPHMVGGAAHGGDRSVAFSGPQRPAPGWADHRTPIPGLYQTGGTTHPGGSITGFPGRNAARVLLHDLGTSLEATVAPNPAP
jgi:phytoene dehydrogenase-like protein